MNSVPTHGLTVDLLAVLDAHGHHCHDDAALGAALVLLGDVVAAYEGRIDSARQPRAEGGAQ